MSETVEDLHTEIHNLQEKIDALIERIGWESNKLTAVLLAMYESQTGLPQKKVMNQITKYLEELCDTEQFIERHLEMDQAKTRRNGTK